MNLFSKKHVPTSFPTKSSPFTPVAFYRDEFETSEVGHEKASASQENKNAHNGLSIQYQFSSSNIDLL